MNIEHLRWWHWILVSLVLGAILAAGRSFYGPGFDRGHPRTLLDYFERDAANLPIVAVDKKLETGPLHPPYLEDLVVHPPDPTKIKEATAYVLDVRSGSATYEVEVKNGRVIQKRDTSEPGPSLVLPVLWKTVPLSGVPSNVQSAATDAVPGGSIIKAQMGPTEIHYWVTGDYVEPQYRPINPADGNSTRVLKYDPEPFLYDSVVPYKPKDQFNMLHHNARNATPAANYNSAAAPRVFPTVMGYLDALKVKYPSSHIVYQYAWWEEPRWVYALWIGGSFLIVGIIWPIVLSLLLGAGYGRTPEPEYDLSRFKGEKAAAKPAATPADLGDLSALNDQLEAGLLAGAKPGVKSAPQPAAPAEEETPFAKPKAPPLEPATAAQKEPGKPKAFGTEGGAYYPTEIHLGNKNKPDSKK